MKITAYDFETTGVDARSCEPVQFASIAIQLRDDGSYRELQQTNSILKIKAEEIPSGASEVHGIYKEDTENGLFPCSVICHLIGKVIGYNNARFDDVIAERYGAVIDQSYDFFKIGMWAKKEGLSPTAKLSDVYTALTGRSSEGAHDALFDVRMTLALIQPTMLHMNMSSVQELLEWVQTVEVDVNMLMPFGKHKGTPLKEMPRSYLEWLHKKADLHGSLKASVAAARKQ